MTQEEQKTLNLVCSSCGMNYSLPRERVMGMENPQFRCRCGTTFGLEQQCAAGKPAKEPLPVNDTDDKSAWLSRQLGFETGQLKSALRTTIMLAAPFVLGLAIGFYGRSGFNSEEKEAAIENQEQTAAVKDIEAAAEAGEGRKEEKNKEDNEGKPVSVAAVKDEIAPVALSALNQIEPAATEAAKTKSEPLEEKSLRPASRLPELPAAINEVPEPVEEPAQFEQFSFEWDGSRLSLDPEEGESSLFRLVMKKTSAVSVLFLEDPPRVVVDISEANTPSKKQLTPPSNPFIKGLRFGKRGQGVRLVLDLYPAINFYSRQQEKELRIQLRRRGS